MTSYSCADGEDIGVVSTANSADVRGNLRLRLAIGGGEAGILVEEQAADEEPRFVAIYFPAADLGRLIQHLQAMQVEHQAISRRGYGKERNH